jgi:hypothetical protein
MNLIIINRKKAGQECADAAYAAGMISKEEVPYVAEELAKLPLGELLSALIESAHIREGDQPGPALAARFSSN